MKKALQFLVDEDLPRQVAQALISAGFQAEDVRNVGLRVMMDEDVLGRLQTKQALGIGVSYSLL